MHYLYVHNNCIFNTNCKKYSINDEITVVNAKTKHFFINGVKFSFLRSLNVIHRHFSVADFFV